MREDAEDKVKRLEDLKKTEVIGELNTLHSQGIELIEPADLSGSLRGRHNLYNHLELTIRNAEKSVTIMTTTQGFLRKIEGLRPTFEKIKKKGVNIKIAAPITKECRDAVKEMAGIAEIRTVSDIKSRFTIVDGKEIDNIKKEVEKADVDEKPNVTNKPRIKTATKVKTKTKKTTKNTAKK